MTLKCTNNKNYIKALKFVKTNVLSDFFEDFPKMEANPSKRAAASIELHRIPYPTRAIDLYFTYLTGARFEKYKEYSSRFREFPLDSEKDKTPIQNASSTFAVHSFGEYIWL